MESLYRYRGMTQGEMAGDELSFERVSQVYREEGRRKTLTPLEADFWERLLTYVRRLEREVEAETSKNPTSPRATLLRDELRKVQKARDQIYAYRERKIAALACSQASGSAVDPKPMTRLEQDLFKRLVEALTASRGEAWGKTIAVGAGEALGPQKSAPEASATSAKSAETAFVEVLEDLPPFAGPGATYRLRRGDLVTLPRPIARVLVDRGKAKEIQFPP